MSTTSTSWLNTLKKASFAFSATVLLSACGSNQAQEARPIKIDGSSTVYPITQALVEKFNVEAGSDIEVTASFSGSGGGFRRFCAGETDISNASRPISRSEMEACKANNIAYIELPVGFDALTVVVHPDNNWVSAITVEELRKMWEPGAQGRVTKWNQVNPSWPDRPIALYAPGIDSGTFDYFTEAIVGRSGAARSDVTASEDDDILVAGVAANPNALGYFGYAYYEANTDKLKALAIDKGDGTSPVMPSEETVRANEYRPLARPLFIYVNAAAARENPLMTDFIDFYLRNAAEAVSSVGYIPFEESDYALLFRNFHKTKVGTAFGGESEFTSTIDEVLTTFTEW